jgi:hypothetical protein
VESLAIALVHSYLAAQSRNKFLPLRMIFHRAGIDLGIGQHLASRIDDGCARSRRLPLLRGNVGDRVLSIHFNAMGKHQSFLFKIALDLFAQRPFPDLVYAYLQGDRGYANH